MQSKRTIKSSSSSQNYDDYFRYDPKNDVKLKPKPFDINKPRVFSFEDIDRYAKIDQPSMSKEKRKMIQNKLDLERDAQVINISRLNKNNLMVRYKENPFMNIHGNDNLEMLPFQYKEKYQHDHIHRGKIMECAERLDSYKNHDNILDAVTALKNRDIFKQQREYDHRNQMIIVSKKINQASKIGSFDHRTTQKEEFHQTQAVRQPTFDQIIEMQDQNFYGKNQIEINLFQFMKGNHKPFLTNEILDKFYFSHVSMADRVTALKVSFARDIGKVGRNFIKDRTFVEPGRMNHITSKQISFKASHLIYQDLMSIGSGRFSPQIVYKTMNEIDFKEQLSVKSEVSFEQINYKDHEAHKKNDYKDKYIEKYEIYDYLKLQDDSDEERYNKKCRNVYHDVQDQLKKQSNLTKNTIKDRHLHQDISRNINERIHFLVDMDNVRDEPQKMIRNKKINKNRNEKNKIRALLDSIVLKNKEEAKIKALLDANN